MVDNHELSKALVERTGAQLAEQSEDDIATVLEYMDEYLKLLSPVNTLNMGMLD